MDQKILNKNNQLIGWCKDLGGQIQAVHITKGYCGYYNKSSNITFDKQGRIFCYGDGAQCLIRNEDNR